MTIPFLGGGGGPLAFAGKSLRFVSVYSNYLVATPGGTNLSRTKTTISFWIKFGFGVGGYIVEAYYDANNRTGVYIDSNAVLTVFNIVSGTLHSSASNFYLRDNSNWHHFVVSIDTTQANAALRARVYANGVEVTSAYTFAQNELTIFGYPSPHLIGCHSGPTALLDSVLADVVMVDGQQLPPTQFAMRDPATGKWVPKSCPTAGLATLGNGFWLSFDNLTSNATLGRDDGLGLRGSGAGSVAFSVGGSLSTGFSENDYPIDHLNSGDFATWSLQDKHPSLPGASAMIGVGPQPYAYHWGVRASFGSVEPFYYEIQAAGSDAVMTTVLGATNGQVYWADNVYVGSFAKALGIGSNTANAYLYASGATVANGSPILLTDKMYGFAVDPVAGKAWLQTANGVWLGGGDAQAGTLPTWTWTPDGLPWFPAASIYGGSNFSCYLFTGQTGFTYTRPARFKRLATCDLSPAPLVTSGTFTGNASTDGPTVWCGGLPSSVTINGNAAAWRTHAIQLATGFKLVTASASYNASGANSWVATVPRSFKYSNASIVN